MTTTPRPATLHDVRALVELEELVFGPDAWSVELLTEEITGPHRHAWVAAEDDETASGFAVTMTVGDLCDLQRIAVHPRRQRQGVATALLDAATREAREAGAQVMLLEVSEANTGAIAFYERHGFEEIDRRPRYYRDGADAIVMRRLLSEGDEA